MLRGYDARVRLKDKRVIVTGAGSGIGRATVMALSEEGARVIASDVARSVDSAALTLVLIAGGLYSVGVVFHLWEKLPFQNAIWHLMVLSATAVLYAAMAVEFV